MKTFLPWEIDRPVSLPGSYLALETTDAGDGKANVRLRTASSTAGDRFVIARCVPLVDGAPCERSAAAPFAAASTALETECGRIVFSFTDARTFSVASDSPRLGLHMDFNVNGNPCQMAFDVPRAASEPRVVLVQGVMTKTKFALSAPAGDMRVECEWTGRGSSVLAVDAVPGDAGFRVVVRECLPEWDLVAPEWDPAAAEAAERAANGNDGEFAPTPPETADLRAAAMRLLASTTVDPRGFMTRRATIMSNHWMNHIWSWDHCFTAFAYAAKAPARAWDEFMSVIDSQADDGSLPDSVGDGDVSRNFVKPPIHGWAYSRMRRMNPEFFENPGRMAETYGRLVRWTDWWTSRRDRSRSGLCAYDHGNDSGWDNSTAFLEMPPIETPDLQAFLVLQMEELAFLAGKTGRAAEAAAWKNRAAGLLGRMTETLFDADGTPLVRQESTGVTYRTESFLPRVSLLLGTRLPERIRSRMISDIDRFLTEWGLATECPASGYYTPDGYWRGPIWAPVTLILNDALRACGRPDLAGEIAGRFIRMCRKSGFAENYDALTGEGLCDKAYAWSAAVFLVLAAENTRV